MSVAGHQPLLAHNDSAAARNRCAPSISDLLSQGDYLGAERALLRQINEAGREAPSLMRAFRMDEQSEFSAELQCDPAVAPLLATVAKGWSQMTPYMDRANEAARASQVQLFADASDELLYVSMIVPIAVCNYRCSYCFLEHTNRPLPGATEHLAEVIDALARIPRPLHVEFSPAGDIVAVPSLWWIYERLAAISNVRVIEVWSNLSRDLRPILHPVPLKRFHIVATYHPTEFKCFDAEHDRFCKHVEALAGQASDITVNFVASRQNLPFYPRIRDDLEAMGVPLTVAAQLGRHKLDGEFYPTCYTEEERAQIRGWISNDFVSHFMLDYRRENVRCTAGRDHLQIDPLGAVRRCDFVHTAYGSLLDAAGPVVNRHASYCEIGGCSCKTYVGFVEACGAEYVRAGTKHHYVARRGHGRAER